MNYNHIFDNFDNIVNNKPIIKQEEIIKTCNGYYIKTNNIEDIFREAISHSRRKTIMKDLIHKSFKNINKYKNMNFTQIFTEVNMICYNLKGIGKLSIYDICSSICRHHNIIINKIYIIGDGPKRAIKLLGLKTKRNNGMNYVEINDVKQAFNDKGYKKDYPKSNNGDEFESWLCNWQKNIK